MVPSYNAAVADNQSKTTWNVEHLRLSIEAAGVALCLETLTSVQTSLGIGCGLMKVVASVLGFGVHWLTANEPALLIEWSTYFGARRPGELNHC